MEAILRNAIDHGHPQLAEEAQDALGKFASSSDKAEVLLTPTSWDNEGWGAGEGSVGLTLNIKRKWQSWGCPAGAPWKDAAYGAVLLVDPSKPGIAEILESSRAAESPLGRVPKQNPDRTISSEGRPARRETFLGHSNGIFCDPPMSLSSLSSWPGSSLSVW